MSSCSSSLLARKLSISQLQRCIPRAWKQNTNEPEDLHKNHLPGDTESLPSGREKSNTDSLFSSLKNFTSHGNLYKAFTTFSLLKLYASYTTDDSNYDLVLQSISSLLLSCTTLKTLQRGKQLHAHIISLGIEQHRLLVDNLVSLYSTCGHLSDAHVVTENSNVSHSLPWNLLISAYVKNGLCGEALSAYQQMVDLGIKPDEYTYPSVLKACGERFDLGFGMEVHRSTDANGLQRSLFVQNALISMYGKCGEVRIARSVFDKMLERDAVSWNSMITAYASKGMWMEAFELFERMRMGSIELNIVIWNTIASGCLHSGNFMGALDLISQMRSFGHCIDSVAMIIVLGACSRLGIAKLGKEIHGAAVRGFYDKIETVRNALITMYSRCKDLRHAYILFRLSKAKSIITWNSMISGYSRLDHSEEASFIFREMLDSGFEPNYVTIASILPLFARVADLQHGKEFHSYIIRHGEFKDYILVWNSLVDMYSKSGKILEAQRVFNSMSRRDEVTYTSLIDGYGMQGDGRTALKLFEEMNSHRITPDHVTMVAVLSACSHSGLVSQGQMLFEKMVTFYEIIPHTEHYACMVDLFGRAGLLRKSEEIITSMPYRPTADMWATLLGACRIHKNVEIGEWAAEKLLEMRPEKAGYYVLIANMYAAAGSWSKLAKVRMLMRDVGVKKAPGCAWIDTGSGFYPFSVGDTSNLHAQEIYFLLKGLNKLIKEAGYVPNEDFGLAKDEFEE